MSIQSDILNNMSSICLFIDFEKAFDSVWKKGLMHKLNNIGINGKLFNIINSFLFSREVSLQINDKIFPSIARTKYIICV